MLHSLLYPLIRKGPVVIIYALLHYEIQIQIANTNILLLAFGSKALCNLESMYTETIHILNIVYCVSYIAFYVHSATFVYHDPE